MLVPLGFWAGIAVFLAIVFGRAKSVEQEQEVAVEQPAIEPVPDTAPLWGGLGWRPAVPSHH